MLTSSLELHWSAYQPLTFDNVQRLAPIEGGVYKLAHPNSEGTLTVFYVGQADNLDSRLKEHLSEAETNACIKRKVGRGDAVFAYAKVLGQRDRDGAERALYDFFKPECNQVKPPGPAIPINPKNG